MRERDGRGAKPWVGGLVAALGLVLSGCIGARTFDLQWDEEVLLHDGRTIVVNVKYTYEHRGGFTLDRHDPSFFREATLKFDAGPPRASSSSASSTEDPCSSTRRAANGMTSANLLMDYAPKKELAAFNGTRVTLGQKSLYLRKYPLGAIDRQIERPAGATT